MATKRAGDGSGETSPLTPPAGGGLEAATVSRARTNVEPRFKDSGTWTCRKALESCTRTKPCPSCLGARNRRSGMRKQRDARKALERVTGKSAARFVGQLGNEESWRLPIRVEVKSGAVAGPVWTKYAAAEAQSNANKSTGDARPFIFVAMGTQTTDGLVVFRLSEMARVVEALVEYA